MVELRGDVRSRRVLKGNGNAGGRSAVARECDADGALWCCVAIAVRCDRASRCSDLSLSDTIGVVGCFDCIGQWCDRSGRMLRSYCSVIRSEGLDASIGLISGSIEHRDARIASLGDVRGASRWVDRIGWKWRWRRAGGWPGTLGCRAHRGRARRVRAGRERRPAVGESVEQRRAVWPGALTGLRCVSKAGGRLGGPVETDFWDMARGLLNGLRIVGLLRRW